MPAAASLLEESTSLDVQRVRDTRQGRQGQVDLSALDLLPMPPVDAGAMRSLFKRQLRLLAQTTRICGELLTEPPLRRGEARHTATLGRHPC